MTGFQTQVNIDMNKPDATVDKPILLSVELANVDVAYQLAQFCRRSTYSLFFDMTEVHLPEGERQTRAYQMIAGIEAVQRALGEAGYNPR